MLDMVSTALQNLPKRRQISNPLSPAASDTSIHDQSQSPQHLSSQSSMMPPSISETSYSPAEILKANNYILKVMRLFGLASMHLSSYECQKALDMLDALPDEVSFQNSNVRAMMGRCYFEMVEYIKVSWCCVFLALRWLGGR